MNSITSSHSDFKYNYIIKNYWGIRLLNVFAGVAFALATFGFFQFINLSIWYAVIFGPLFAIVFANRMSTFLVNVFYPHFDLDKHKEFISHFWLSNPEPSVDIFLPIAGEPAEILKKTWDGVKSITYTNKKVYVLDDAYTDEIKHLAERYGFTYLSRPNSGEYKKSGNIKYGYEHSEGDYIFILDADFRPIPEALIEAVPYIANNANVSILQTPQYFENTPEIRKNSPIQYGAGSAVEDFYRVVLPSRARFGNAMCVGTSALYRRKAIAESGMPLVSHTEDVRQGLMTYKHGYHVGYLPVIVSSGVCPDNIESYTKQQIRWSFGSFETILSNYFTGAQFDSWGKLNYVSSFLYYLSESVAPLLSLQLLFLLYFHDESLRLSWAIPFIPYLFYQLIIKPRFTLNKNALGLRLVGLAHTYIYSTALIRFIFGKKLEWEATNSGGHTHDMSPIYKFVRNYSYIYTALFTLSFVAICALKPYILLNFETYIVVAFCLYRIKNNAEFAWHNYRYTTRDTEISHEKASEPAMKKPQPQLLG
jgi:cellulose synthase (UDP-forming)